MTETETREGPRLIYDEADRPRLEWEIRQGSIDPDQIRVGRETPAGEVFERVRWTDDDQARLQQIQEADRIERGWREAEARRVAAERIAATEPPPPEWVPEPPTWEQIDQAEEIPTWEPPEFAPEPPTWEEVERFGDVDDVPPAPIPEPPDMGEEPPPMELEEEEEEEEEAEDLPQLEPPTEDPGPLPKGYVPPASSGFVGKDFTPDEFKRYAESLAGIGIAVDGWAETTNGKTYPLPAAGPNSGLNAWLDLHGIHRGDITSYHVTQTVITDHYPFDLWTGERTGGAITAAQVADVKGMIMAEFGLDVKTQA